MPHLAQLPRSCRSAFTLMELLIVIGIVTVLIAIGLAVGNAVRASAQDRLTLATLQMLDQSLTEYVSVKSTIPPAVVKHPVLNNQYQPVADASDGGGLGNGDIIPSLGWYIVQLEECEPARKVIDAINAKLINVSNQTPGAPANSPNDKGFRTVRDAWGNPIRYVHPAYQGFVNGAGSASTPKSTIDLLGAAPNAGTYTTATLLRNATNSDAGRAGSRPYFYSVGPDGKAETTVDNIYINKPDFAID
jgi:prepilin-type N-terminal cleavage/methylation domain-containing protein